jgi:hypothetical protein
MPTGWSLGANSVCLSGYAAIRSWVITTLALILPLFHPPRYTAKEDLRSVHIRRRSTSRKVSILVLSRARWEVSWFHRCTCEQCRYSIWLSPSCRERRSANTVQYYPLDHRCLSSCFWFSLLLVIAPGTIQYFVDIIYNINDYTRMTSLVHSFTCTGTFMEVPQASLEPKGPSW